MSALELPYLSADAPGWGSWIFAAFVLLAVLGALASRRALEQGLPMPPPGELYPQVAVQLLALLGVTLLAAWDAGIDLVPRSLPGPTGPGWGALALVAMLASAVVLWRFTPQEERERRAAFLPRSPRERVLCAGVAVLAGLAEECAWRAVLPALLLHWTGNAWLAAGLSALSFALAHSVQGRLAMFVVFAVAILFQALVVATGSLVVAVVVHAAYDALVGLWLGGYLRRRDLAASAGADGPRP